MIIPPPSSPPLTITWDGFNWHLIVAARATHAAGRSGFARNGRSASVGYIWLGWQLWSHSSDLVRGKYFVIEQFFSQVHKNGHTVAVVRASPKLCLPSKVVFRPRSSSIEGCLPLKVVFHRRVSFNGGRLLLKVVSAPKLPNRPQKWNKQISSGRKNEDNLKNKGNSTKRNNPRKKDNPKDNKAQSFC